MEIMPGIIAEFERYKAYGDRSFAQLSEADLLDRPNASMNSIATIVQHLHGNMLSRWTNFLTDDGEKSWRQRDAEFEPSQDNREEILRKWEEGWAVLFQALRSLKETDLDKTITIRQEPYLVLAAIHRQLAHYASHVGQIMLLGKWKKGDSWQSLSIPLHQSQEFNDRLMGKS